MSGDEEPLARFRGVRPRVTWALWLIFVGANIGDVLWRGRDRAGVLVLLVLLAISLLLWLVDVRPQVLAFRDRLAIRGGFRDVDIPWQEISDLERGPSLVVHTPAGKFRSPSVSARLGDIFRSSRPRNRGPQPGQSTRLADPKRTVVDFAADELEELQRRNRQSSADGPVRVVWRWLEIAALSLVVVAIVVLGVTA